MLVTSRYVAGTRRGSADGVQTLARQAIESYCLAGAPLAPGTGTQPGTRMRRLLVPALALAAACGTRPDHQRLDTQTGAPRGEPGVVARRLLSESQFNDRGYPTADGRFLSTTDMSTGDLAVRDLSTGALRRVGLKDSWASDAYAESSIMSPDGRRIAVAWADAESRYSIRVVDADGRNPRVVYDDSTYYYMEVNGFAPDGRHVIVELDHPNGLFDYGWLDLDGGGMRLLFEHV